MNRKLFVLIVLLMVCFGTRQSLTAQASPNQTPTIGNGCKVFPDNNTWNRDISKDPVDPNSANYINSMGPTAHVHPDFGSDPTYGIPYIVVAGNTPKVPISFYGAPDESDPGPYPMPSNSPVEAGSDAHVLAIDGDNCKLYELYAASWNGTGWDAYSGAIFDLKSNLLRPDGWTSADAAGLPVFPGLVRYDEVKSGAITHALRVTIPVTQRKYIHPATHYASSNTNPNVPPMGLRLRMKASYNINSFTGDARVIATALKKYGTLIADNSGGLAFAISGSTDIRWNDTDLDQLKSIPLSAFEVVQSGTVTQPDKIGVYNSGVFYLRNANAAGNADIQTAFGGDPSDLPVVGDWNGDGIDTIGLYRNSIGVFFLSNSNTSPVVDYTGVFGNPGDTPFAGKWTAAMTSDGLGVYRNSNGVLYERIDLSSGVSNYFAIYGNPGDKGFAGDWNADGLDSIGVYRSSNTTWFLTNNSQPSGVTFSNINFAWTIGTADPVVGDWDGDGIATVGYRTSAGAFKLHSANAVAGTDLNFSFGPANGKPIAGNWTGSPVLPPPPVMPDILVSGPQPGIVNIPSGGAD